MIEKQKFQIGDKVWAIWECQPGGPDWWIFDGDEALRIKKVKKPCPCNCHWCLHKDYQYILSNDNNYGYRDIFRTKEEALKACKRRNKVA